MAWAALGAHGSLACRPWRAQPAGRASRLLTPAGAAQGGPPSGGGGGPGASADVLARIKKAREYKQGGGSPPAEPQAAAPPLPTHPPPGPPAPSAPRLPASAAAPTAAAAPPAQTADTGSSVLAGGAGAEAVLARIQKAREYKQGGVQQLERQQSGPSAGGEAAAQAGGGDGDSLSAALAAVEQLGQGEQPGRGGGADTAAGWLASVVSKEQAQVGAPASRLSCTPALQIPATFGPLPHACTASETSCCLVEECCLLAEYKYHCGFAMCRAAGPWAAYGGHHIDEGGRDEAERGERAGWQSAALPRASCACSCVYCRRWARCRGTLQARRRSTGGRALQPHRQQLGALLPC